METYQVQLRRSFQRLRPLFRSRNVRECDASRRSRRYFRYGRIEHAANLAIYSTVC